MTLCSSKDWAPEIPAGILSHPLNSQRRGAGFPAQGTGWGLNLYLPGPACVLNRVSLAYSAIPAFPASLSALVEALVPMPQMTHSLGEEEKGQ